MVSFANGVSGTALPAGGSTMGQGSSWVEMGIYAGVGYRQISGEFVVTNSSDTSERQLLEGYMAWKWGTQALLPSNHPYKNAPPVSASETYYTGGNQSYAGLNFGAASSATTLLGGTSGGAAANTMTIGSGGITVAAATGATTLGEASGATVSLVVGANQTWTNNSSSLLRAHNGISRAAGDVTNRVLTIAGSGSTQLDGAITNGGAAGTLGLVKQDAGLLLLGGANTFTGSTTITGGTLALGAAASLASSAIGIDSGAVLDLSALAFTLGSGQSIGGKGSILGNFVFGAGSNFKFTVGESLQLSLASGTASFASTFGVANVLGIDETTPEGTYTLIDGTVNFTNVINVGAANAVPIGDGTKSAYLQQGSLQLVVVPEPSAVTLAGVGVMSLAWAIRRRLAAR
jgi:autotransporter-associated beta strand protein